MKPYFNIFNYISTIWFFILYHFMKKNTCKVIEKKVYLFLCDTLFIKLHLICKMFIIQKRKQLRKTNPFSEPQLTNYLVQATFQQLISSQHQSPWTTNQSIVLLSPQQTRATFRRNQQFDLEPRVQQVEWTRQKRLRDFEFAQSGQ